jgi:pimeloyl-ACP methyl ester carboxylesterase
MTGFAEDMEAVLLPTLLTGSWLWRHQRALLEAQGLRLVELDTPFAAMGEVASIADLEAFCLALLARRGRRHILLGCSMGGLVALRVARRTGRCVAVVVSGSPGLGQAPDLTIGTRWLLEPSLEPHVLAQVFVRSDVLDPADAARVRAEVQGARAARAGLRLVRALRGVDLSADLSAMRTPALLVWGAEDRISPPAAWAERSAGLPAIEFRAIPDAGHCPMYEQPARFNGVLAAFLGRLRQQPLAD